MPTSRSWFGAAVLLQKVFLPTKKLESNVKNENNNQNNNNNDNNNDNNNVPERVFALALCRRLIDSALLAYKQDVRIQTCSFFFVGFIYLFIIIY